MPAVVSSLLAGQRDNALGRESFQIIAVLSQDPGFFGSWPLGQHLEPLWPQEIDKLPAILSHAAHPRSHGKECADNWDRNESSRAAESDCRVAVAVASGSPDTFRHGLQPPPVHYAG